MPTVVPVTDTLPTDRLPDTEALPAPRVPDINAVVDVRLVAVRVPVVTDVRPVTVGDRFRVTAPLGALAVRLVPATILVTPELTIVIVPVATEFDSPLPVAILAVVNDEASVNTFTKLF